MKRFQLTLAAALLASASSFAAGQFTGSFACKAKYSGKNTYLMDSCRVNYTYKKVAGAPSYSAKVSWTKLPGYTVGGVSVNASDVAKFKNYNQRYNDIAPTKAVFKFTVLFYSDDFKGYIGSAQASMTVNDLEKSGAEFGPQILNISSWNDLFSNIVIGKQSASKIGTVNADAAFDKWCTEQNIKTGKADANERDGRRAINRVFTNATRMEIVNPSVDLTWDINEYVFLNNAMKMVDNISDDIANGDTLGARREYFLNNPGMPTVIPTQDNFWNSTVFPYSLVNDAYDAAEAAYKKGDYNAAAISYQKVLSLDSTVSYCNHRLAKISEYQKSKEARTVGGIDLVYVEGNGKVKSFYISKTEITMGQWRRVMGTVPVANYVGTEMRDLPVANITWEEAHNFVKKLNEQTEQNYRLVTAAEWEYAANGGVKSSKSAFAGGDNIADIAWTVYNAEDQAHKVATKDPNELGIYDMTGNVAEWVANAYDKKKRIVKGGSYADNAANCSISAQQLFDLTYKSNTIGFRIALDE